ncbi:MAG: hypothetical protein Q8L53_16745 [Aestuariivirga sp.]|nr:hypothetical protein [Aestuariivirga sp.]
MTFPSKRSGINHNLGASGNAGAPEHDALVDMFRGGTTFGPFSTGWAEGEMFNADNVDSITGFPNTAGTRTRSVGGFGVYMVASTEFSGKRVLTWDGDGEFIFNTGTWTVDTDLSSNYAEVSNGRYTGTDPYIVITYTGAGGVISSRFIQHDRSNTGDFITAAHFYRLEDEARFLAGKCFRTGYLQNYVTLNPGYIRFMNTGAINNSLECRYEHHNKSTRQAWGGRNHLACDTYGEITGTNAYAIADSAGSPEAMKHGEVVIGRVTNGMVRGGAKTITGITKDNPGVVTAAAHGFNDGDVVTFSISAGMVELAFRPCTVANKTDDTFELSGVNTTAFTTFTAGTVMQYITLNRSGLGAYPVVFEDGTTPASNYSNNYIAAGDYKTFSFDKHHVASTLINGAWLFSNLGATPKTQGQSPEIMAQFMIELNEMQVEQGLGPTDMWVCVPHRGLLSVDPDYDAESHFGIGLVGDILNGANGYEGLATNTSTAARCSLIVEGTSEDWNFGGTGFSQTYYQARLGFLRYGGSASDASSYSTIRKVILVNDLKAAFPAHPQLKYPMCGQGSVGISSPNVTRITGNANYDGDAWNTWGGDPIDHFDGFAWAGYFQAGTTFDNANLATLAANYAAATTDAGREAECQSYVDGVLGSAASGKTVNRYRNTLLPAYCNEMAAHGKIAFQYEGGWDRAISGSEEVQAFLVAVKKSRAWARAWQYYLQGFVSQAGNANVAALAYYPADYIMIDARWGHATPDTYANEIEGGNLDMAWVQGGKFNRGIRSFIGSA